MPAEEPSFSSKQLADAGDEPKIKSRRLKIVPNKKKRRQTTAGVFVTTGKQTKIAQQLAQIYQDDKGHLPDMRKIKMKKKHPALKTFFIIIFLGSLLAAAAWAGFFLMPNNKKFSEDSIKLNISGPKDVISGTTSTYKISYENDQNLALKKATINVQYPAGFVFLSSIPDAKNSGHTEWRIGDIGARKKNEITITGLTYGSLDQKQSLRIFLTYQPENFESELQKASVFNITAAKVPFSLAVSGPTKTTAGNVSEYIYTVKKESDSQINKLELKPSWPQNFFITSSSPAVGKDHKWIIEPNKTTSSELVFKLTGKFSPAASGTSSAYDGSNTVNSGIIAATLYAINNSNVFTLAGAKTTTELTQNNMDFSLAINGAMTNFSSQPGDGLSMTLSLKNQSADDLKNVSVKLNLDAPAAKKQSMLNWPEIEDKYDGDVRGIQINDNLRRGEIIWDKNKIPALAKINKGQEIIIDVRLPIRDGSWPNLSDVNTSSQITALAEINFKDSSGITRAFSSNRIIITINSDLKFEARDSVSSLPNGERGEKHQVTWVLTNNFHPLKNLLLSADVYGDAKVELASTAPAGTANFDTLNKKITWAIPEMPEGVDVLALPIAITLNAVNPTQELLISKTRIQADDSITGEKLNFMGEEIGLNRQ